MHRLVGLDAAQLAVQEATSNGTWVLTEQDFYNPASPPSAMRKNKGPVDYTSKHNEYYKYKDYFLGAEDGFVRFLVSGGYQGPGASSIRNSYFECSVPASSYVAGAKVTVKAVSGATKYQVRYKVGNAKKWKVVKAKKSTAFTVKVAKGKKVTAQACACNSSGWSAWCKAKSLKTDKK